MASLLQILHFLSIAFLFIHGTSTSDQIPKPYVVYMGSSKSNTNGVDAQFSDSTHLQLLSSMIPREESERSALIHHSSHALSGFSAMLAENEASLLSVTHVLIFLLGGVALNLMSFVSGNDECTGISTGSCVPKKKKFIYDH